MKDNLTIAIKKPIVLIAIAIIVTLVTTGFVSSNSLKKLEESTNKSWADVEASYQRRADLIPQLVEVAKKASSNEKEILDGLVQARAAAISTTVKTGDTQGLSNSQAEVTQSLNKLIAISEDYPELTSTQAWIDLSAELAGAENRIYTARRDFNDVIEKYNAKVITFPSSVFAKMLGFEKVDYFKSEIGTEKPVDLNLE